MFLRNVLLTYFTEIICAVVNFATGILLARVLSPADRGVMVLVMTLPNLMFNLLNAGLHESTTYFVGRRKVPANQVLGNALLIAAMIGGAAFAALMALRAPLTGLFLKGLPSGLWPVVALLVPAALAQGILLSMLRAQMRFVRMNAWRLVGPVMLLVGFALALLVFGGGLRAGVLVYFWMSMPLLILAILLVAQVVPLHFRPDGRLMRDMLQYGLKSYAQVLISGMNYRLDVYLVSLFLTTEEVAYYGVAFALAEIAWFLPNAAGTVLFPRLSNAPLEDVHRLTARASRVIVAFTALTAVAVALASPLVPGVYGRPYWRSIPPLLILLPGVVMMSMHKLLGRNFASRNRQQFTVIASAVALALILLLDVLLIPRFGVEGAALASSIGYFAAALTLILFFLRDSGLRPGEILLVRYEDLSLVLAALKTRLPGGFRLAQAGKDKQ